MLHWAVYGLFASLAVLSGLSYYNLTPGLILRKILDCTGGDTYCERGAQAYNGVWGRAPSGVQGQSSWSGGQGAKPP